MTQINGSLLNTSTLFRFGTFLCMLTLLYGVVLGGVFGAAESQIKSNLRDRYEAAIADGTLNAPADGGATLRSKAWTYVKRSHLHANGMGAGAMGLALALVLSGAVKRWGGLAMMAAGLGGLGYAIFWMLAGFKLVEMGSGNATKEALSWIAIPSAGLYVLAILFGTLAVLFTCRCGCCGGNTCATDGALS